MGKKSFALALLFILGFSATRLPGQTSSKYWIFFNDKQTASAPALAQHSLERRARLGIATDDKDRPVSPAYLNALSAAGVSSKNVSRWLNAVSAWLTPDQLTQVRALSFVRDIKLIPRVNVVYDAPETTADKGYNPGYSHDQIQMLGLDSLHSAGYTGRGVIISVMDNGFRNVNINPKLSHLYNENRILAMKDFVDGDNDPLDGGSHGAFVLSILAGFAADQYHGSAPGATYILCRTENDASETHQEEDNWVAAMEYADSLGADIFSTSLGYSNGMGDYVVINGDTITDYTYADMDGNTCIITVAADIAASRGILVVNSAGNNGALKLNAPADGDSVLAIGAVDSNGVYAGFSSQGPRVDGMIKPNVTAMGRGTFFIDTEGFISAGSGTSFSCPVMSGFSACLLQANPQKGGMLLFDAIQQSADRFTAPDSLYGYGIPSARKAYKLMSGEDLQYVTVSGNYSENGIVVFPTLVTEELHVSFNTAETAQHLTLQIFDVTGRKFLEVPATVGISVQHVVLRRSEQLSSLTPGKYILRVLPDDREESLFGGIFILAN